MLNCTKFHGFQNYGIFRQGGKYDWSMTAGNITLLYG